jgi:pimeloyl-ACP methyl ester carboxylesterase
VRFAYRRFGNPSATPLVFLQHFRGSMDNWDPALLNGFAKDRTVITFDNAGVGFSSGEVPDNVAAMGSTLWTSSTPSGSGRSICSASRWVAISLSTWPYTTPSNTTRCSASTPRSSWRAERDHREHRQLVKRLKVQTKKLD